MKYWLPVTAALCALLVSWPTADAQQKPAYLQQLQERAQQLDLASSRQWHRLMHYRERTFGGFKSDVDSPEFFLADDGKYDPEGELLATLEAFFEPARAVPEEYDWTQEHPQCRFRARYAWLERELDFDDERLEVRDCYHYGEWRDTIRARSATLIFASAYMNNPASMFGHTLLRLDRSERGHGSNLTSYVVNYAAEPWTENALLYTVLGVSGGFDARFSTMPFYLKTREYTDMENRELWEYALEFSDEQLARMVRHLWEMQPYTMDYFYFDENCSFHLLSLIEVADPSLRLTEQFDLTVIPADTVRTVLEAEGLSGQRLHRPSRRAIMLEQRARLDAHEVELAKRLGNGRDDAAMKEVGKLPIERQAAVLDAAHALWSFLDRADERDDRDWAHELLVTRGKLDVVSEEVEVEPGAPPEVSHGTARISLAGGVSPSQRGFAELGFRPSLHDLAAPEAGYAPLSQIEFADLRVRALGLDEHLQTPTFVLQKFDIIDIVSLAPLDGWDKKWSWGFKTGLDRTYRDTCPAWGCLIYDAALGFGGTVEWGPLATYLLLDAEVGVGKTFDDWVRLGAGPRLGGLLRVGEFMRVHLEGRYRYPFLGESFPQPFPTFVDGGDTEPPWSATAAVSFRLSRNVEARLNGIFARERAEADAAFYVYW